jgi:ABC-2 type transport system permease protein
VTGRRTLGTALRVLTQLRHDPRTIALLLLAPCVLLALLRGVLNLTAFDTAGPALLGLFPFITMFLVTSVATLRERTSGTLERLLTTRLTKAELLAGYSLAFGLVGVIQALLACAMTVGPLGLKVTGWVGVLVVFAVIDSLLGMALGLLVSAFARTEFQAVQFLPAVVLPQVLLCGLIAPRDRMPSGLRWLSDALPLSYAADGLTRVARVTSWDPTIALDLFLVIGATVLALVLAAVTLRRRTA